MGRIQSNIGLITGVPITDTVNQLLALSARPRDILASRNKQLGEQQVAIGELIASVLAVQFASDNLGKEATFAKKSAQSSDAGLLSATVTGDPPAGVYQFTPVRRAQAHQLLSSGLASLDGPLGEGSLKVRHGGFADSGVELSVLNGGAGVARGKIRITDRRGDTAVIDLTGAKTIDDVVAAINGADGVDVSAATDGDSLRLTDHTGESGNLRVQEVSGGQTAADLGLAGINTAADSAAGQDLLRLYGGLSLGQLNDRTGVALRDQLDDLTITFRDNSAALGIDLGGADTLQDVIDAINAADPARLSAAIGAGGDRIELTDLTVDAGGTFSAGSTVGGSAAEDLGLAGQAAAGAAISSRRLLAGLKTSLISGLGGGSGLDGLGQIEITDRSGASATVDLSAAETLDDAINIINAAAVGVEAKINTARNGLLLSDTTGVTAGNLVIANGGDGKLTADKLGLSVNAAQSSIDGGSLDLRVVSRQSKLASYRGGEGVAQGSFSITNSSGNSGTVSIGAGDETVGDVIDKINALSLGVEARINETGDGILLVDTLAGGQGIQVKAVGGAATAADLRLLGASAEVQLEGQPTQVIDGSQTFKIDISATDTLADVAEKINGLGAGFSASVLNEGGGAAPYRLTLISDKTGRAGELLVDAAGAGFSFQEIAAAQDALLQFGAAGAGGVLASSSDNTFKGIIDGLSLTVNASSAATVSVTVARDEKSLVSAAKAFVDQYNKLVDKLAGFTFFNDVDNSTGILFGSLEALAVETDLSDLLSGSFFGVGSIRSLAELGFGFAEDGKLTLDEARLTEKFAADRDAVEEFFTNEELGLAAKIDAVADRLAGVDNSLLISRNNALQQTIEQNSLRIDALSERLEVERERLLNQFFAMETAIARLQENLRVIEALQPIAPNSTSLA